MDGAADRRPADDDGDAARGEALDATRARDLGLVHTVATGDGEDGRSAAVTEALRMAATPAAAPRELVVATKASMRTTAGLTAHREAVEVEVGPQLDSLRSEGFAAGLERVRSATKKR